MCLRRIGASCHELDDEFPGSQGDGKKEYLGTMHSATLQHCVENACEIYMWPSVPVCRQRPKNYSREHNYWGDGLDKRTAVVSLVINIVSIWNVLLARWVLKRRRRALPFS